MPQNGFPSSAMARTTPAIISSAASRSVSVTNGRVWSGIEYRPHTARVRAPVSLERALVVLHERHGGQVRAVDEGLERELLALQPLLDHDRPADLADVGAGSRAVDLLARDPDALAPVRPTGLTAAVARVVEDEPDGLVGVGEEPSTRGNRGSRAAWQVPGPGLVGSSIRAAARVGPNAGMPAPARASASPASSGASGPITARSTPDSTANRTTRGTSVSGASRRASASGAIPGFLVAMAAARPAAPSRTSEAAIACSRPPPPTTRYYDRHVYDGTEAFQNKRLPVLIRQSSAPGRAARGGPRPRPAAPPRRPRGRRP